MRLSAFITKTRPEERGDTFEECYAMAKEMFDEVIVVDGEKTWPKEFDWKIIGEHFQRGYMKATGDFVFHLDTDFFFHEKDFQSIRELCWNNAHTPAIAFPKRQFILPDRYTIKSRLVVAVNKAVYGDRIRFDSGGDLAQPSKDGVYIEPSMTLQTTIPMWNYECIKKTREQLMEDKGRFARAWNRHFDDYKLGGPDDESAYSEWLKMVTGRFNKVMEFIPLDQHPRYIQDVIKRLTPDQWGWGGFGLVEGGVYAQRNVHS